MTSIKSKPQEPLREAVEPQQGQVQNQKQCRGECVSGLFALFCDDLDSEAFCPNEGSCCINAPADGNQQHQKERPTTPKPTASVTQTLFIIYLSSI